MTQLSFTEIGGVYVATATVSGDFALHVEREKASKLQVLVSTVENKQYACKYEGLEGNIDQDFQGLVYPKYIKVISATEPGEDCYVIENESE